MNNLRKIVGLDLSEEGRVRIEYEDGGSDYPVSFYTQEEIDFLVKLQKLGSGKTVDLVSDSELKTEFTKRGLVIKQ